MAKKRTYRRRDPGAPKPQFALNIRRLREKAGLTQEELAEASGLSTIVMIETGRRPYARDSTLGRIAKALSEALGAVWPWGAPSVKAWYFALEAMRASKREG